MLSLAASSVNLAVAENDIRLALLRLTAAGQAPVVSKASNIPTISGRGVIYAFPFSSSIPSHLASLADEQEISRLVDAGGKIGRSALIGVKLHH